MSVCFEENFREEHLRLAAGKIMTAARTAPKACGIDNLIIARADRDDIAALAETMRAIGTRHGIPFFSRDADNLKNCTCAVLIGTKISPLGLKKCGMCGFPGCAEKPLNTPCVFNTGDLGIALGSASASAADERIDTRVMYTIGQAAMELGLLGAEAKIIYGLPLSVSGKSPFFDRK